MKHGFYALALLEGLAGTADFNRDGLVHLWEVDRYALLRVRQLAAGGQNPTAVRPATVRSIPLTKQ